MAAAVPPQLDTPWVEKYRPTVFDDIVIEPTNQRILRNILATRYFPNLLLHGPPGTGKTTTVLNLIAAYQPDPHAYNTLVLNASDDRGIDVIRDQIQTFAQFRSMFATSEAELKFVVLDEVDYMTKSAQHAFQYLLMTTTLPNVRFCLMCNYISKIDPGLQHHFLKLRYNQLPADAVHQFLRTIADRETVAVNDATLRTICAHFKSDIRSMINFLQLNRPLLRHGSNNKSPISLQNPPQLPPLQHKIHGRNVFHGGPQRPPQLVQIIDDTHWAKLLAQIRSGGGEFRLEKWVEFCYNTSAQYNIDIPTLIKTFAMYVVRHSRDDINLNPLLDALENVLHEPAGTIAADLCLKYVLQKMSLCFVRQVHMI